MLEKYPNYSNTVEELLENGDLRKTYSYYDPEENLMELIVFVTIHGEIVEIRLINR